MLKPSIFFEQIHSHIEKGLPFAVYRKPNSDQIVAYLQSDLSNQNDGTLSEGFLIAPFQPDEVQVVIRIDQVLRTSWNSKRINSSFVEPKWNDIKRKEKDHIDLVKKALETINKSELKKVVLATSLMSAVHPTSSSLLFKRILDRYRNTFNFWFSHPVCGNWLGATPELLLSMDSNRLHTMALAGTRKKGGAEWGHKEIEEQALVVSEIKQTIFRLTSGNSNIIIENSQNKKAGAVEHILTQISAEVNATPIEVAKALHPTPAVGGVPKSAAIHFIESQENLHRSYYAGFLGPFEAHQADWYVNLRSMRIESQQAEVFVGGGITADSDPQSEWEELIQKANTMGCILSK